MSAEPINFSEVKEAKRLIVLDPDKIDSGLSVLLDGYPNIDKVKTRFYRFWVLFDELQAELASAQISHDLNNLGFTSETVLAIYLCNQTAACEDVEAAWQAAYEYLEIDGSEDDSEIINNKESEA